MATRKNDDGTAQPVTHWHARNSALGDQESATYATAKDARVMVGDYLTLARALNLPIKEPTPGRWRICNPHDLDEFSEIYIEECSGTNCPGALSGMEPMLRSIGERRA